MSASASSYWLPRHRVYLLLLAALTLGSACSLALLLAPGGLTLLEAALLLVFALLQGWIAACCLVSLFGFVELLRAPRDPLLAEPVAAAERKGNLVDLDRRRRPQAAIVMPIYNEDVERVFAGLRSIYRSLTELGALDRFHVFVLSDTRNPEIWRREELAWEEACRDLKAGNRLFYRRRDENVGRKSGNIADFCKRWGRRYEYMIVLDADSLMSAQTLVQMLRTMEARPRLGLLQVWPRPVNGETLFARIQQFAAAAYGRLMAAGISRLQLGACNYWGHNAIIRTRAFMESCGLPSLPGRPPLGGEILSHDFVEAALLIRAGWEVRLSYAALDSYEDGPPTLVDHLKRDRRWCQGNLQHLRLVFARGLHPMSRLNFLLGVMAYLCSPIWMLFALLGIAVAWEGGLSQAIAGPAALDPAFGSASSWVAAGLATVTALLLVGPKLMGAWLVLTDRQARRGHGGAPAFLASLLAEILFAALLAPTMMLRHSLFVATIVTGASVGWDPQARAAHRFSLAEALAVHRLELALGLALTAAGLAIGEGLVWWLLPLVLGLLLAAPLSALSAGARVGAAARRWRLFLIPEEWQAPPILARLPLLLGLEALLPAEARSGGGAERVR